MRGRILPFTERARRACSTRTKGHNFEWLPRGEQQIKWLTAILDYLRTNRAYLPVLGRQIFYDLIGRALASKEPRNTAGKSYDYIKVMQLLNDARRAQLIDWDDIADEDGPVHLGVIERHAKDVLDDTGRILMQYVEMDLWRRQPQRVAIFVEAAGQVTQVTRMVESHRIPVFASGGFTGSTRTHGFAKAAAGLGQPLHVLTIGDLDPSGWQIVQAREADILAFAEHYGAAISFEHVALTLEQAQSYPNGIEPLTAKDRQHSHAFRYPYDIKVQSAAMPPADLKKILSDRIGELVVNRKAWKAAHALEVREQKAVGAQVERWQRGAP